MNTALAYEVQKAMLAERLNMASRPPLPEPDRQRLRRPRCLARRAIAAVILALAAWAALGATAALAAGKTLYVSSSASSDPACGLASQSNPFATIAGALGCAANGSTISIGAGSFAGGFIVTHNVVLQGTGADTVIRSDASVRLVSVTEVTVADGHNVTLKNLTVDGGGRQHDVVAGSGSLMVVNSTITGGVADFAGGAINVSPATGTTANLTVLRSTIANNLAFTYGGGIYVAAGSGASARNSVSVIDSTVTGNQANSAGGAIKIGLFDSLTARDSTIARNEAIQFGGGVWAETAGVSTSSASVALTNTILAANTADATPDCQVTQGVTDGGHNLVGAVDGSCPGITEGVNGDQAGTLASPLDPVLAQLASNGGPTPTLALRLGSPAIGAGDPADCPAAPVSGTDQRNQKRNAATRLACDTGAYDTGGTPLQALYVNRSASSDPACGLASQSNPFATIAGALACAANGSTIRIGAGSFAGGFTVTHNVVLQGAGASTVIKSDPSVPIQSVTEVTVADGHNVTLKRLTVDGGLRQRDVVVGSGSLMVVSSTLRGGVSTYGGAIDVSPASGTTAKLTVLRSTLANNLGFNYGGAIYVADASTGRNSVSVIDSTLTGNQSDGAAGAIKIGYFGSLVVRDSTIARNQATHDSGGLWVQGAPGAPGSTSVALTNTILAANTVGVVGTTPDCEVQNASVTDGGHNLIGAVDASCPGITNAVNGDHAGMLASPLDPVLGPLASNGGPTQTLALRPGSPAIGAADPADCQATPVSGSDQRNQRRNAVTRLACDIGAYDTGGR